MKKFSSINKYKHLLNNIITPFSPKNRTVDQGYHRKIDFNKNPEKYRGITINDFIV